MTKNLFLLFSFYFFVVQAIILGLLTGNVLFYQLGGINAGAMLIVSLLYFLFTKSPSETLPPAKKAELKEQIVEEHSVPPVKEGLP